MTREEHLKWSKDRALEYLNNNDLTNAYASIMSDLSKHPELKEHPGIALGMRKMLGGFFMEKDKINKFISGFN